DCPCERFTARQFARSLRCGREGGTETVAIPAAGAIDCDIHPALPGTHVLVPYLDEYWRAHVLMRGLQRDNYDLAAVPANAAINVRPDWKPATGAAGTDPDLLRQHALD